MSLHGVSNVQHALTALDGAKSVAERIEGVKKLWEYAQPLITLVMRLNHPGFQP
jgi:hypothetical protein